jgi:Protoglobin
VAPETAIPGYAYGSDEAARSPVSGEELDLLKQTVLFSPQDQDALRLAGEVLEDQVEQLLDVWYGFVASHPHLVRYFADAEGSPIDRYLARVRARFGQWVHDLCRRDWDRAWLDYQEEVALRHTAAKKNRTDEAEGAPAEIPLRYMIAFIYPITATVREFLASKGHDEAQVEAMHHAWFKAVTLSVVLWSRPYAERHW